jgi:hypothetical protein
LGEIMPLEKYIKSLIATESLNLILGLNSEENNQKEGWKIRFGTDHKGDIHTHANYHKNDNTGFSLQLNLSEIYRKLQKLNESNP